MSGEDHNQAVAHAATGLGGKPDKEKIRGGGRSGGGEKRGVACAPGSQGEKKKGGREGESGVWGARWKNRVHLTSARVCSSFATMPCCCVRSASMSMPMRGNVMCGISCHHHHDELFVCQCVLQPAIPVCVCAESTPVQAAGGAHTPKKENKRESVCV